MAGSSSKKNLQLYLSVRKDNGYMQRPAWFNKNELRQALEEVEKEAVEKEPTQSKLKPKTKKSDKKQSAKKNDKKQPTKKSDKKLPAAILQKNEKQPTAISRPSRKRSAPGKLSDYVQKPVAKTSYKKQEDKQVVQNNQEVGNQNVVRELFKSSDDDEVEFHGFPPKPKKMKTSSKKAEVEKNGLDGVQDVQLIPNDMIKSVTSCISLSKSEVEMKFDKISGKILAPTTPANNTAVNESRIMKLFYQKNQ